MECPCGNEFVVMKYDLFARIKKKPGGKIYCSEDGTSSKFFNEIELSFPSKGEKIGESEFIDLAGFHDDKPWQRKDGSWLETYDQI